MHALAAHLAALTLRCMCSNRLFQATTLLVVVVWTSRYLGGYRFSPIPTADGANDTSGLFNLHPLLMTLAFVVLMAEALQAYRMPIFPVSRFGLNVFISTLPPVDPAAAFLSVCLSVWHTSRHPPDRESPIYITETNRIHLILFVMQNWAARHSRTLCLCFGCG
jgi:hypothetical protein